MTFPRLLVSVLLAGFVASWFVFSDNYRGAQLGTKTSFHSLQDKTKRLPSVSPLSSIEPTAKRINGLMISPSFRISETSTFLGERGAGSAEAACNPDNNEYLVVWESDGLTEVKGVNEIYGQRLSGATNERIGISFRISTLTDGNKNHTSNRPKVVYNRTAGEYFVIWNGSGLFDSPDKFFEVFGQRLSRTGKQIGTNFRLSYTTDLGKVNTNFVRTSSQADLAWNSANNEYLVVWKTIGEPEDIVKMEIYGQRVKANGELLGKSFRISHTTDQGTNFQSNAPAIAYNSRDNQYLIVWTGGFKNETKVEVWGQGLSATGTPGSTNEFRLSQVTDVGQNRRATSPHVVYNNTNNEYFVVFQANGLPGESSAGVNEIFGQRIDAARLAETGPDDFRISNAVGAGNGSSKPTVAFNSVTKDYLVIWRSIRQNGLYEISGQRISAAGTEIEADFQISNIAAVGSDRTINNPSLAHNTGNGECFVVWQGNGLPGDTTAKITEIFGQRLAPERSQGR